MTETETFRNWFIRQKYGKEKGFRLCVMQHVMRIDVASKYITSLELLESYIRDVTDLLGEAPEIDLFIRDMVAVWFSWIALTTRDFSPYEGRIVDLGEGLSFIVTGGHIKPYSDKTKQMERAIIEVRNRRN